MTHLPALIRGIVEGFYGVYYTFPERNDLIRFAARHGFNTYIYGPKNDRQHRARWWEPYPADIMAQFAETIELASAAGVTFIYSLSPVNAKLHDLDRIMPKLLAFYELGARTFGLMLDDTGGSALDHEAVPHAADTASEHATIVNSVYQRLQALDPACKLLFCQPEYHGSTPFSPYLHTLGQQLHPDVDLFYTGPSVCSPTISAEDIQAFASAAGRTPILWDNYPTNDLDMRAELHLGPLQGRAAQLATATRGIVVNPMNQCEASKIPLLTYAAFLADPAGYDPLVTWEHALREVGGAASYEALRLVAENALYSCLSPVYAPRLMALTREAIAELRGEQSPSNGEALQRLEAHINDLDEACYALKNRMANLRLRDNMIPWIEALEDWVWMARRAILVLRAAERGEPYRATYTAMRESLLVIGQHHKRMCGEALVPLAEYVDEYLAQEQRVHAPTPVFTLRTALG